MLTKTSGDTDKKPRYQELAEIFREEILGGKFARDGQFPTEAVLCARHRVSRFTVREALRMLQSEGLIKRRRGSGTLVQPAAARAGALHQPLSNVEEILQYASDTNILFEPAGLLQLPKKYAEQIGLAGPETWFHFKGIRTPVGNGLPIAVTDAYVHPDLTEAAQQIEPSAKTLFQQLEQHAGVTVSRVLQDIQAVAAPAAVAEQLKIARRSPCLRILRCYVDASGRIFEISVSHHPGDRFAYSMHIEVDA